MDATAAKNINDVHSQCGKGGFGPVWAGSRANYRVLFSVEFVRKSISVRGFSGWNSNLRCQEM